ncbi:MAG: hypothetical protein Q9172_002810 [Xanthocarpia lactea]
MTVYWFKILRSILLLSTVHISQKNPRSLLSNFIMRCHHRFLYLSLILSPLLVSLVQAVPPSGAGAHARAAAGPPAGAVNAGSRTRPKDSPEPNSQMGPNPPKGPKPPRGPHGNMQTSTHGQEEQREKKEPPGSVDAPVTDNRTPESKPSNREKPRQRQKENSGDGDDGDPTTSTEAQASATPATGRGRNQDGSTAETTARSTTPDATPSASPTLVSSARGTVDLFASQVRLVGLLLGSLIFGVYAC